MFHNFSNELLEIVTLKRDTCYYVDFFKYLVLHYCEHSGASQKLSLVISNSNILDFQYVNYLFGFEVLLLKHRYPKFIQKNLHVYTQN